MASWDTASVNAPGAMSYAAGLTDFSPLGNLANDAYKGAENRRQYDLQRAFKDGLPTLPGTNIPDIGSMAQTLARLGGVENAVSLANAAAGQQANLGASDFLAGGNGGQPATAPAPAPGGETSQPRGIRNNNPGNIENGPFTARQPGYTGPESKGRFATFDTPQAGIAAAQNLLGVYGQQGINTISGVINRWAPPSDKNDTTAYAQTVASKLGLAPDAPINLADPQMRARLSRAMFVVENGRAVGGDSTAGGSPAIPPTGIPQGSPDGKPPVVIGAGDPAAPNAQGVYGADATMLPQDGTAAPGARVQVAGPPMAGGGAQPPAPAGAPVPAPAAPSPQPAQGGPLSGDPSLGGLIPQQWIAKGGTPETYLNALLARAAQPNIAANAKDALLARAKAVQDTMAKWNEPTPDLKNYRADALPGESMADYQARAAGLKAAAEPTGPMKEAAADRRPGESLSDYQARVAGGKKYAEGEAERFGKKYEAITKAGAESAAELPKLALAKQYMASPDFYSGPAEGLTLGYKRVLATIDPSQANSAAPQEAFRKIISDSVRSQIRSLAESGVGRISIPEVRIIEKAAANQENTPAANRLLVELSARMHQQTLGLDDLARKYNGGRLDPGFDTAARAWVQQHPIVTPAELKDPRIIAPPVYATPDAVRAAGLPKGAPFQTPDGRTKYVP